MKKIFALIFTALILFTCVSCGQKEDKTSAKELYEIYTAAEKKTNSLTAYYAKMTQSAVVTLEDESTSTLTMETIRKANLENESDPEIYYQIKITQDSDKTETESTYYKDGVTYSKNANGKVYYSTSADEIVSSYKSPAAFALDENAFSKAELLSTENGKSIYVKPNDTSLDSFAGVFSSAIFGTDNVSMEDTELTVDIDKNGYLSSIVLKFTAYNDSLSCENAVTIEFIKPGTAPEITPPNDIDTYISRDEYESNPPSDTDISVDTQSADTESSDETTSEWDNVSDKDGEAVDAAFALFDENYNKVENYDELYKKACDEYGKDTMDSIIEVIMALTSLS